MTSHTWDEPTGYCTHCGILKGWHAEECLATPNCHGMMHIIAKRKREGKIVALGTDPHLAPIIVEGFPKEPV